MNLSSVLEECNFCPFFVSVSSFLPRANEVWGKVIFSVVCVKNSVHGEESTLAGTPPWQVHPQAGTPGQVHPPG